MSFSYLRKGGQLKAWWKELEVRETNSENSCYNLLITQPVMALNAEQDKEEDSKLNFHVSVHKWIYVYSFILISLLSDVKMSGFF